MSQQWNYPGARWWKFDFHTHTPASTDTPAWQLAKGSDQEVTPETWLRKFMEAEIDCVAVTDHNSGEWIDKLQTAYREMKREHSDGQVEGVFRELVIYPGVELSVNGGFHVLAIFDPEENGQKIEQLLGRVQHEGQRGTSDGVTQLSLYQVIDAIQSLSGIAIPAHVDGPKGILEVESDGKSTADAMTIRKALQLPKLSALEWKNPKSPIPKFLKGQTLHFASVVGSDCHNFQGNAIPGSAFTWVKMEVANLEGLRLALLDGQGLSIRRCDENPHEFFPNQPPKHCVESIEISNARFMGRRNKPQTLEFHPYFNALIGGRGTGKSTIVHALRLAYQKQNGLVIDSQPQQTFNAFCKKITNRRDSVGGLLPDTSIKLTVLRDGVRYRVVWNADKGDLDLEKEDPAAGGFISVGVCPENYFPVRILSQGQIASLTGESQSELIDIIDEAAGVNPKQAELEEQKKNFFALQARKRIVDGKLTALPELELTLNDIQQKLEKFEGTDHAAVLKDFQRVKRQEKELSRQFDTADEIAEQIKNFACSIHAEDVPEGVFEEERDGIELMAVKDLHQEIDSARRQIHMLGVSLEKRSHDLFQRLKDGDWQKKLQAATVAYEQLKQTLQQQGVTDPTEYGRLVQEKLRVSAEIKRLASLRSQSAELQQESKDVYRKIQQIRKDVTQLRQRFLAEKLRDNKYVRIEVVPYGASAQESEDSLREVLGAEGQTFADEIYQNLEDGNASGLIAQILSETDKQTADSTRDGTAVEALLLWMKEKLTQACQGEPEFGKRFNAFLVKQTQNKAEFVDHIRCWFPGDGLRVEYSRKGDGKDFQSIRQASAGQRSAALLAFLLAYGDEPLVLDQPEDDLDNQLIYDLVVQQIRSTKLHRQLIVVTHNPNIVVNGDAELVFVMDFNNQCYVKTHSSLQNSKIRSEVCRVMEGGKEAFKQRYQRLEEAL